MTQKAERIYELMSEETVHGVAELAKECFTTPWSEDIYQRELTNPRAITYICRENNRVIAFINCGFVMDELSINTLVVSPDYRHQGIARRLWTMTMDMVKDICTVCYLEVRESNVPARTLYESLGFIQNGYRPRYYQKPEEAAVLMARDL